MDPVADRISTRSLAIAILAVATATIAGALASQHVFGLVPCKLCLEQRWPFYVGVPLAAATAAVPAGPLRRAGFGLLAIAFLVSAGLGAYHAGVEWGFWLGPNDCGGGSGTTGSAGDLLRSLETIRVVSCTEAAWRFMGLSLAGWNVLVSIGLVALAILGAASRRVQA